LSKIHSYRLLFRRFCLTKFELIPISLIELFLPGEDESLSEKNAFKFDALETIIGFLASKTA